MAKMWTVLVLIQSIGANPAGWSPPHAEGAPPLLPPGIKMPTKGRSMASQSGYGQKAVTDHPNAWSPPAASGAPPLLPDGVRITPGQSMMPANGNPAVNGGWKPPVAHGAPPMMPEGITLPPGGGSMMKKMAPSKAPKDKDAAVPLKEYAPNHGVVTVNPNRVESNEVDEPTPENNQKAVLESEDSEHMDMPEDAPTESSASSVVFNTFTVVFSMYFLF